MVGPHIIYLTTSTTIKKFDGSYIIRGPTTTMGMFGYVLVYIGMYGYVWVCIGM